MAMRRSAAPTASMMHHYERTDCLENRVCGFDGLTYDNRLGCFVNARALSSEPPHLFLGGGGSKPLAKECSQHWRARRPEGPKLHGLIGQRTLSTSVLTGRLPWVSRLRSVPTMPPTEHGRSRES